MTCATSCGLRPWSARFFLASGWILAILSTSSALSEGAPGDSLHKKIPLGLPESLRESRASESEAELGRRLFFDPILSVDRTVACSSCHRPDHGFSDDQPVSKGVNGHSTLRNAPTLYNRALGRAFMWDGRFQELAEQVLFPIENELEMGLPVKEAVSRLQADPEWRSLFEKAFQKPPSRQLLGKALAAFVSRLLHANSRVDYFRNGEADILSAEERAGMWFFESRGACWRCHSGPNFSDERFHNTGVGALAGEPERGRFEITKYSKDMGRFKTPTLRGLTQTGPYMHDGSFTTLEEVVEFYRKGGNRNSNQDPLIEPLQMSNADARNLVAFLRALSGEVERSR